MFVCDVWPVNVHVQALPGPFAVCGSAVVMRSDGYLIREFIDF